MSEFQYIDMTLRDYFAASRVEPHSVDLAKEMGANIDLMNDDALDDWYVLTDPKEIRAAEARIRYAYADAMLAERAKGVA